MNKAPGGLCEEVKQVLGLMEKHADVRTWRIAEREILQTYAFGKAALLGDSAHAMAPTLGQGELENVKVAPSHLTDIVGLGVNQVLEIVSG